MRYPAISPDGKHKKTCITHDIWLRDAKTDTHAKLTDYIGEDRNPVWSPDERNVHHLSAYPNNPAAR